MTLGAPDYILIALFLAKIVCQFFTKHSVCIELISFKLLPESHQYPQKVGHSRSSGVLVYLVYLFSCGKQLL